MALSLKNYIGVISPTNEARVQEILDLLPNKGKAELNEINDIREIILKDGGDLSDTHIDYGYIGRVPVNRKPGWHNTFIFALASTLNDPGSDYPDGYDSVSFVYFTMSEGEIEWTDVALKSEDVDGLNSYNYNVVEENLQEYLDYEHLVLATLDNDRGLVDVLNI